MHLRSASAVASTTTADGVTGVVCPRKAVRLIAFYLPQFHPIPENDHWWGKGFTEWTNVVQARPLFTGHYQPHLPGELGFYDLRLPQTRQAQADLAREHGIFGFCYYHYWNLGKRLLSQPFDEVLASGQPDFPFCLCWANEDWTRTWDDQGHHVLLPQRYSEEDDINHIRWLAKAFRDRRYIRYQDKPMFLVYQARKLPDPRRTTLTWREEAQRLGIGDLFLCHVERHPLDIRSPDELGFDAAVEFQPRDVDYPLRRGRRWKLLSQLKLASAAYQNNDIFDYPSLVRRALAQPESRYQCFRCVTPSWDNTPRRQRGAGILIESSPEAYECWLRAVIQKGRVKDEPDTTVFINAWNEWGEGCHLEPDLRFGRAFLEATRNAVEPT